MKTSELIGPALDWAVAKCEGRAVKAVGKSKHIYHDVHGGSRFGPSTNWAQGGPIIEREGIALDCLRTCGEIDSWIAASENLRADDEDEYSYPVEFTGSTPLVAAMRCYVASKLGNNIEIPEELQ